MKRKVIYLFVALALIASLAVTIFAASPAGAQEATTVLVDNLQPNWTAPGGGGVYSSYAGYPDYDYVSPGTTDLYLGREAGIIKAGLTPEPDGSYWDDGIFGFQPNVTIEVFAASTYTLTYDVANQYGENPVWMTIDIDTGVVGDRNDDTVYQHVPTSNPAGWHTVDAAAGLWQKWNDYMGDVTGNPLISLNTVAADNNGLNVTRTYLRLGMGASYHGSAGLGTVAWVDKATLGGVTYDFVVPTYWYVATTGSDTNEGTLASPFLTIQKAIDSAGTGDTVNVAAGTYNETLNIDGRSNLNIVGADKTTTILKSSTTRSWAIPGYPQYDARQAVVRVVSSTGINFSNMTFDFDLVKGNNVVGVFYWDSSGTLNNNILKNMSVPDASGGYYEITSYVRAPSYTDGARAQVAFTGNTFINTGRLGICTHDFVNTTIMGNTFYKNIDDFGYAMEIGSRSTATISGNTIYGYDTPAASDGSESAGIYIENCFTGGLPHVVKNVTVGPNNEIYGCQWALYIGNEFDGYAGDVDIVVALNGNNFHDNLDGAAVITDEDKENGSSVTVTGSGNTLTNNGDAGYYIHASMDGDITVDLSGETITGQIVGVFLNESGGSGGSGSAYNIAINCSTITGNTAFGIQNTIDGVTVNAECNWWGNAGGPGVNGDTAGLVDYTPWLLTQGGLCAPGLISPTDTTNVPGSSITFVWSAVTGAAKYWLEVNTSLSWGTTTRVYYNYPSPLSATSQLVSGFPNTGQTYYWRVWAGNAAGWGPESSAWSVVNGTQGGGLPGTPTLKTPPDTQSVVGSSIPFVWDPVTGATKYWLEVNTSLSWGTTTRVYYNYPSPLSATSQTVSGFPNTGQTYYWRVWAGNSVGWGPESSAWSVVNGSGIPGIPVLRSPGDGDSVAGPSISFVWDAVTGAAKYWLEVNTSLSWGTTTRVYYNYPSPLISATSQLVSGLPNTGQIYYWRVWAGNAAGWGTESSTRHVHNP